MTIVYTCLCCGREWTLDDFRKLRPCGPQPWILDEPDMPAIEMRHCECRSTISIVVETDGTYIQREQEE